MINKKHPKYAEYKAKCDEVMDEYDSEYRKAILLEPRCLDGKMKRDVKSKYDSILRNLRKEYSFLFIVQNENQD